MILLLPALFFFLIFLLIDWCLVRNKSPLERQKEDEEQEKFNRMHR